MKARTFLALGLITVTPSLLFAQAYAEPREAMTPSAPKAPRAPSAAVLSLPATVSLAEAPPLPPSAEMPQPPAAPKAVPAPAPAAPSAPAAAPAPPRPLGQMLNVQIEVTLSDSKGTSKTVMLTVADGEMGQNRTGSDLQLTAASSKTFGFNADARPTIAGNKIRLYLSAEAQVPAFDAKGVSAAGISLRQSQTLILNDGDSVEIARAADPVSDRAFILSVKVKIQR